MGKHVHKIELHMNGSRFIATELNHNITITRDGADAGKARWNDDQLVLSSALIPDNVVFALEKKLKEAMDNNWWED